MYWILVRWGGGGQFHNPLPPYRSLVWKRSRKCRTNITVRLEHRDTIWSSWSLRGSTTSLSAKLEDSLSILWQQSWQLISWASLSLHFTAWSAVTTSFFSLTPLLLDALYPLHSTLATKSTTRSDETRSTFKLQYYCTYSCFVSALFDRRIKSAELNSNGAGALVYFINVKASFVFS